jgi:hypothetical protein
MRLHQAVFATAVFIAANAAGHDGAVSAKEIQETWIGKDLVVRRHPERM